MKPFVARAHGSPAIILVVASLLLGGCYDAIFIPKVAPPKLPTLRDGVEIELTEATYKSNQFRVNNDGEIVRKRKRTSSASYDGQALTYAQVDAMGNPEYDKKLDHLQKLRSTCRRGTVPQVIGYASAIASAVIGGLTSYRHKSGEPRTDGEQTSLYTAYGLAGVTAAAYGVGYVIGGWACADFGVYRRQNMRLDDPSTDFYGDRVDLVHTLAAQFNERRAHSVEASR